MLDTERHELFARAGRLPHRPEPRGLRGVVPDWASLTDAERHLVIASAFPLRSLLPNLADAGARIVLLPIDVRTVDRPEWAAEKGQRFDDQRAMDALSGVASAAEMLAAVRVEELLDVASDHALVFAHELAHLAYFVTPDPEPIQALFQRAAQTPYVVTDYQLENDDELFAVAYQDYLRERYELPRLREYDDLGVWRDLVAYFDALANTEPR